MGNKSRTGLTGVPPQFLEPDKSTTALEKPHFPLVSEFFTPPFTGSISATGGNLSKERNRGETYVVSHANTDLRTGDILLTLNIDDGGSNSRLRLDELRSPAGFPYGDSLTNSAGIRATIGLPPFAGSDAAVEVVAEIEFLGADAKLETDAINVLATVVWDIGVAGGQVTSKPAASQLYLLRTRGSSLDNRREPNQTLTFTGTLAPGSAALTVDMGARLDFERIHGPSRAARSNIHLGGAGLSPRAGNPSSWPQPIAPTPIVRLLNFSVNVSTTTP
jgi:hypothetical protein